MKINEELIALFDSYQLGNLPSSEVEAFETRLRNDGEFQKEFQAYIALEKGIHKHFLKEAKGKLQDFDRILDGKQESNTENIEPSATKIRSYHYWIAAAAALVVLLGTVVLNSLSNNSKIVETHWIQEPGLPVKMSQGQKYDEAMNLYKTQKWKECIQALNDFQTDTAFYYQGHAFLKLEQEELAFQSFKRIEPSSTYFEKSIFSQALLLLKMEKKEEAKSMLKSIESGHSNYSKQASDILSEI